MRKTSLTNADLGPSVVENHHLVENRKPEFATHSERQQPWGVSNAREAIMVNRDGRSHVLGARLLSISPASTFCWLEGLRSREMLERRDFGESSK